MDNCFFLAVFFINKSFIKINSYKKNREIYNRDRYVKKDFNNTYIFLSRMEERNIYNKIIKINKLRFEY